MCIRRRGGHVLCPGGRGVTRCVRLAVFLLLCGGAFAGAVAAPASTVDEGLAAYQAGDYVRALKWYRKLAAQGDAWGQNRLGHMYENGRGVSRDYAEAVKWYRKSAAQGNAVGQANLGYMYENGRGVSQDRAEAVKWYQRSAEQGFSSRQFELDRVNRNGASVSRRRNTAVPAQCTAAEQDADEHINWCVRAVDHGGPTKSSRKLAGSFLGGFGLKKASSKATFKAAGAPKSRRAKAAWQCRQMAVAGVAAAQFHLGRLLLTGGGVARNTGEAHMWLTLAAAKGHACAAGHRDVLTKKLSRAEMRKARQRAVRCLQSDYKDCEVEAKEWWQKITNW